MDFSGLFSKTKREIVDELVYPIDRPFAMIFNLLIGENEFELLFITGVKQVDRELLDRLANELVMSSVDDCLEVNDGERLRLLFVVDGKRGSKNLFIGDDCSR